MDVSIGIITHNNERNIHSLLSVLLKQKLKALKIKEIIVVSSGSTDKTNEIVQAFSKKDSRIRLITETERKGKVFAINKFLRYTSADIIVQISGDVLLKANSVEELCKPLLDKSIGIVGCRPVPVNTKNDLMGFIVNLQWQLHHEICLSRPKFGEMIAFRKEFKSIPKVAMDEECIASLIEKKGLKGYYAPKSIIYNKGPTNISDFIKQRRRNYAGHLVLKKQHEYTASTMQHNLILRKLLKIIPRIRKDLIWIVPAIALEAYGRALGAFDFYIKKEKHIVWKIAESAKFDNEKQLARFEH